MSLQASSCSICLPLKKQSTLGLGYQYYAGTVAHHRGGMGVGKHLLFTHHFFLKHQGNHHGKNQNFVRLLTLTYSFEENQNISTPRHKGVLIWRQWKFRVTLFLSKSLTELHKDKGSFCSILSPFPCLRLDENSLLVLLYQLRARGARECANRPSCPFSFLPLSHPRSQGFAFSPL